MRQTQFEISQTLLNGLKRFNSVGRNAVTFDTYYGLEIDQTVRGYTDIASFLLTAMKNKNANYNFPYPQVFYGRKVILVCLANAIWEVTSGTLNMLFFFAPGVTTPTYATISSPTVPGFDSWVITGDNMTVSASQIKVNSAGTGRSVKYTFPASRLGDKVRLTYTIANYVSGKVDVYINGILKASESANVVGKVITVDNDGTENEYSFEFRPDDPAQLDVTTAVFEEYKNPITANKIWQFADFHDSWYLTNGSTFLYREDATADHFVTKGIIGCLAHKGRLITCGFSGAILDAWSDIIASDQLGSNWIMWSPIGRDYRAFLTDHHDAAVASSYTKPTAPNAQLNWLSHADITDRTFDLVISNITFKIIVSTGLDDTATTKYIKTGNSADYPDKIGLEIQGKVNEAFGQHICTYSVVGSGTTADVTFDFDWHQLGTSGNTVRFSIADAAAPGTALTASGLGGNFDYVDRSPIADSRFNPGVAGSSSEGTDSAYSKIYKLLDENELGFVPMNWQGDAVRMLPLGEGFVVYGKEGISYLEPVLEPVPTFRKTDLFNVGIPDCKTVAGNKDAHLFMDTEGFIYLLQANLQVERLDYRAITVNFTTKADVLILFQERKRRWFLQDDSFCYMFYNGVLTEIGQFVTSVGEYLGNEVATDKLLEKTGGSYVTTNTTNIKIVTSVLNMKTVGIKNIVTVSAELVPGFDVTFQDIEMRILYRYDQSATFIESASRVLNSEGWAHFNIAGTEFKIDLRCTKKTAFELNALNIVYQPIDKRFIRTRHVVKDN